MNKRPMEASPSCSIDIEDFLTSKRIKFPQYRRESVYEFIKSIMQTILSWNRTIDTKTKSIEILCQNSLERMLCYRLAEYLNYSFETIKENTNIPITCNGYWYDTKHPKGIPIPLMRYFGGDCQCGGLPERYSNDRRCYQDYDEYVQYSLPWTYKTGVRIIFDISRVFSQLKYNRQSYLYNISKELFEYLQKFLG